MLGEPGVERGWYHDRRPEFREFQSLFAGSGTKETAVFNETNNDLNFYPKTPFQVLYVASTETSVNGDPDHPDVAVTGGNSFTVSSGTSFYVPLLTVNDAPPVIGNFPTKASGAASYFFDQDQLGVKNTEIIVDGQSTAIERAYVAGPVQTPRPLPDGSRPYIITLAAFLSPMSVGTHTVDIKGELTGQAFQADTGLNSVSFDFTYTVQVG
jgi:hypothetical protein